MTQHQNKPEEEHMHMWGANLRAVFRAMFGTNASCETEEARKEALEAIGLMGQEAEDLKILVEEVPICACAKPVLDLNEAFEAMVRDMRQ